MKTFIQKDKAIIILNSAVTRENAGDVVDFVYGLEFLDEIKKIDVRINSEGGNVMGGYDIYMALVNSTKRVYTRVEGIAASIAGIIYMAGMTREMTQFALFMIHDPFVSNGESDEEMTSKVKGSLMEILGDKFDDLFNKMEKETWYSAEEMKGMGLVDNIISIKDGKIKKEKVEVENKTAKIQELANTLISKEFKDMAINNEKELEEEKVTTESKSEDIKSEEVTESKSEEKEETPKEETLDEKEEEVKSEEEAPKEKEVETEVEAKSDIDKTENKIEDLTNIISSLKSENEEIRKELNEYKSKEEKEAKTEILNKHGIEAKNHDKWMKLDIDTIKNLCSTVNVKSPEVKVTGSKDIEISNMSYEDRQELFKNDPELYTQLIKNRKKQK